MKIKVGMLSLGCARNLVDAEVILGQLKQAGFVVCEDIPEADIAIVNTCCFIREAEEESIDVILQVCQLKQQGRIEKIVVCGCLAQRHKRALINALKEVDAFVDLGNIDKITLILKQLLNGRRNFGFFGRPEFLYSHSSPRVFLTPKHFAYIKISEGCGHVCSYCIIPRLRGRYRSRPMSSILKEAQALLNKRGVREINLIGQDTTMYGRDLYAQARLPGLLIKLSRQAASIGPVKTKGRWIRLLYTHPAHFSPQLIAVIKDRPAICKYVDLPIQHINDKILQRMRRGTSRSQIVSLIGLLRKEIPQLAIRTTIIVGFPGESQRQFKELLDFIREVKFERLGLFKYSPQEQTAAYNFGGQIPEKIKERRYQQALALQQDISMEINAGFLGKKVQVLIDEQDEKDKGIFYGRTQYDAPEVDGGVYVHSKRRLKPGDFVQVKITDTLEYDLVGEAL